ncbi:hypothetical protein ABZU32_36365 [Sphaerisporangium sp. NPDC005288]|uniref:hypothetical protein n=1 Tax=Sphaerisporangium sp. NPDC005288 TaxID=3155114 RepID=UPI0033B9D8E3
MDGFFVDYGGLRDFVRGHSARQPDVDAFPGALSELMPRPADYPEAAGDFRTRFDRHASAAATTAALLREGHHKAGADVRTAGLRYGQAEEATAGMVAASGEHSAGRTGAVLGGLGVQASAILASVAGAGRAARMGRSPAMPAAGGGGSALLTMAATLIVIANARDPEAWERRGLAAARLGTNVTEHADGVQGAVRASHDHLRGEAGDAFRSLMLSDVVAPTRTLSEAVGEMSAAALAAGDAQRRFNERIVKGAPLAMLAGAPAGYLLPPTQVTVAALWLIYVVNCRKRLRQDLEAAGGYLGRTGALSEVAGRLGRDRPAPGRPPAVTI